MAQDGLQEDGERIPGKWILRPKASAKWSWVDSEGVTKESTTKRGWIWNSSQTMTVTVLYTMRWSLLALSPTLSVMLIGERHTRLVSLGMFQTTSFNLCWLSCGFNHELANSKVIGAPQNGAKNWLWELNHNDWSPSSSEKIDPTTVGFKMWN